MHDEDATSTIRQTFGWRSLESDRPPNARSDSFGLRVLSVMDRPRNPPMRPLVLVVDEHEDTRDMYALALSAMGFDIVAAEDGRDAYRRAWEIHPDAIVADLPMPNYEEWQFLQDLKQNARTREIPLVAVSGYVHRSTGEHTVHDGFDAFFPKPCLPDELAAALRQLLDGKSDGHAEC